MRLSNKKHISIIKCIYYNIRRLFENPGTYNKYLNFLNPFCHIEIKIYGVTAIITSVDELKVYTNDKIVYLRDRGKMSLFLMHFNKRKMRKNYISIC